MTLKPKTNHPVLQRLRHERKIEAQAIADTKKRISEVFRGLEKTLA